VNNIPNILEKHLDIDIKCIYVVPVYREQEYLPSLLESLQKCTIPINPTIFLFIVNQSENHDLSVLLNNKACIDMIRMQQNTPLLIFEHLWVNLPQKDAGVGMARKIGMDLAAQYFNKKNINGAIICLDADCKVETNYLIEIEKYFKSNPKTNGISIYFEHPLHQENQESIVKYELFLRYYTHAIAYTGHPYAFQTVGSAMACTSKAYIKQGGMNKRKAGEDFYFLQKIMYLGNFDNLTTTTVYPSSRKSERVPFGTGRSIIDHEKDENSIHAYQPFCFEDMKTLFTNLQNIYLSKTENEILEKIELLGFNVLSIRFLLENNFSKNCIQTIFNSSSFETFKNRFFQKFDLFFVMKWVHYVDKFLSKYNLELGAKEILQLKFPNKIFSNSALDLLLFYRKIDKGG
jgi:glycosyltransferase involved in cell wall biosynthesis